MTNRRPGDGGLLLLDTRNVSIRVTWGRRRTPRTPGPRVQPDEVRDLLNDVTAVLAGEQRVKLPDVAARLRAIAPDYEPYRDLNGKILAELLGDAGVQVTYLHGFQMVWTDRVRAVLAARDASERAAGTTSHDD